jgi:type II secretory ATPase GspE/PulE/Tfp pilus assembly ATPase PilB-like protein
MIAEKLYSPSQVAQLLGTTSAEVDGWIRQGRLESLRLPGGRVGVGELALVRFLKSQGIDLQEMMAQVLVEEAKSPRPELDDVPADSGPAETGCHAEQSEASRRATMGQRAPQRDSLRPCSEPALSLPKGQASPPTTGAQNDNLLHVTDNLVTPRPGADPAAPASSAPPRQAPPPRVELAPPLKAEDSAATHSALAAAGPVAEAILRDALRRGATAIHFESQSDGLTLRLRLGGRLYEKPNFRRRFPSAMAPNLLAAFKRLVGLDVLESHRPQEGALKLTLAGQELDLRISTCPTQFGQNLVVILQPAAAAPAAMDDLGLAPEDLAALRQVLAEPAGLILVTAPLGANTARTLLALAAAATAHDRSTAVLSDGFGAALPGAIHVSRARAIGLGDAAVIRALQRQDADAIVIDEIRDAPAFVAAVCAAQAGSKVLAASIDHSLAADPTILTAAGADPLAVSQALRAMIVQRTLRRICLHCKAPAPVDPDLLHRLAVDPSSAGPTWIGRGCDLCRHTGFSGEVDAMAVMIVDPTVARRISMRSDAPSIDEAARRRSARTLPEAVLGLAWEGVTSLEEAARVLGW